MKRLSLLLLPILFSLNVFAEEYKVLDLVKEFPKEHRIEMVGFDGLKINLDSMYSIYHVQAESGPLADCKVLEFSETNKTTTIAFDPMLDDGMNTCVVTLYARNGSKFNLELFVDVAN